MSVNVYLVADHTLPATVYSDQQIKDLAAALTDWLNRDVGPAWGNAWQGHYPVVAIPRGSALPPPSRHVWLFYFKANSDIQGALGYHTLDAQSNPYANIFVVDSLADNVPVEYVTSHELVEALVNRDVDATSLGTAPDGGTAFYFNEAGDPVEGSGGYQFTSGGKQWLMTDFCLPSYFHEVGSSPYSFKSHAPAPLKPAPNGLQSFFENGQWHQMDGAGRVSMSTELPKILRGVRKP